MSSTLRATTNISATFHKYSLARATAGAFRLRVRPLDRHSSALGGAHRSREAAVLELYATHQGERYEVPYAVEPDLRLMLTGGGGRRRPAPGGRKYTADGALAPRALLRHRGAARQGSYLSILGAAVEPGLPLPEEIARLAR